jgi:esterase/lipase superfamily enzyme
VRRYVGVFLLIVTAACAPRPEVIQYDDDALPARPIFVGTTRGPDPETGKKLSFSRLEEVRFARYEVSVPPERELGEISVTPRNRAPDPALDFLVTAQDHYTAPSGFRADLRSELSRTDGEAIVFVHGYNNNFAEGLYRVAQLGNDLKVPGVLIHYSWPSRGSTMGYAYDRDSALFARDGLERLLAEVRAAGARRITIVAHSMGSALAMETLRQMAIAGKDSALGGIDGVVLISPDLDVDVFRAQAQRIGRLPQPFIIFTSQRDRALQLAARLTGESARLGTLDDINRVADLKVTMVEVGAFSIADGHFNIARSPALIALLGSAGDVAAVLEGEQRGRTGLVPGVFLTVQEATRVVLAPVGELAGELAN